MKLRWL